MPGRDRFTTILIKLQVWSEIVSAGLISVVSLSLIGVLLWYAVSNWGGRSHQERVSTDAELNLTLKVMESNAQQATKLMERFQAEVAARAQALRETETTLKQLQHQRSLLDLTADQRSALRELVARDPSMRDIFMSRGFWLGTILPGLCFFFLGVGFNEWRSRRSQREKSV